MVTVSGEPPKMLHDLLQPQHLLIVLVVALFVFGPKKLPELGQGLGKGIRSFRDSMKQISEEPEKAEPKQAEQAK
jgi:sec-independent protein translocase protein TatA